MPLVLVCGLPGSGKSRRAEELRAALSADEGGDGAGRRVFVVSEADFFEGGRSALRAETERLLNRRDVVIVEAGGELKSFRYELYCLSKHAGTPHCLLFCPGGAAHPDRPPLEPQGAQRGGVQPGQFVPVAVEGLAAGGGGGGQEAPPGLRLHRPVSLAELSRLRRQFLSYAKMHPGEGEEDLPQLGNMFLQYLSRNLQ
nr:LOW QUALITY PROTEIN: protein KTI12 homolog [Pogona vitticeps]